MNIKYVYHFITKQEIMKYLLWREMIMQAKQSTTEPHGIIKIKFHPLTNWVWGPYCSKPSFSPSIYSPSVKHTCHKLNGVLKTKTPKTSKTPKDPPYFFGAPKLRPVRRQYDCKLSIGDKNFSVLDWHLTNWFRFKSKNFVFCFKQGTYPLSLRSF